MCLAWPAHKELVCAGWGIAVTLTWHSSGLGVSICSFSSLSPCFFGKCCVCAPRLASHPIPGWALPQPLSPSGCPLAVLRHRRCSPRCTWISSCTCFGSVQLGRCRHMCLVLQTHWTILCCTCKRSVHPAAQGEKTSFTKVHYEPLKTSRKKMGSGIVCLIGFKYRVWGSLLLRVTTSSGIPAAGLIFQGEGLFLLTFFTESFQCRTRWFWAEMIDPRSETHYFCRTCSPWG